VVVSDHRIDRCSHSEHEGSLDPSQQWCNQLVVASVEYDIVPAWIHFDRTGTVVPYITNVYDGRINNHCTMRDDSFLDKSWYYDIHYYHDCNVVDDEDDDDDDDDGGGP
jgi:hypothetical protein